jgi:hypothetical protein
MYVYMYAHTLYIEWQAFAGYTSILQHSQSLYRRYLHPSSEGAHMSYSDHTGLPNGEQ